LSNQKVTTKLFLTINVEIKFSYTNQCTTRIW